MTHASLFSGIGGFDLAAEWMGWENVFHCEYDPFCQRVLAHHFPNSKLYDDVRTFDATKYRGRIDVLSGGFPCQPFSVAGQRKGTDDERHLWPEMLRIIREVQPRYVLGENVRGLLNWSDGLVFEQVCTDLEAAGYEVTPYILPACAVNAPHRRDRVWFVAYSNHFRTCTRLGEVQGADGEVPERNDDAQPCYASSRNAANTDSTTVERQRVCRPGERKPNRRNRCEIRNPWETFPTVAPICGPDDGISRRMDGITFPKWRSESIKSYGNAIVPQVALQIFKSIHETELLLR
jgi:DNA (cytosine-5)-methyltransferase 1